MGDAAGQLSSCRFVVFIAYLTLPGGNQEICGAAALERVVDGLEIELCDQHFAEAQRALSAGPPEVVSFADGPDGHPMLVIVHAPPPAAEGTMEEAAPLA